MWLEGTLKALKLRNGTGGLILKFLLEFRDPEYVKERTKYGGEWN
jgi:hypothetical protein